MGKKMKFPSIFNINTSTYPPPPPPPPPSSTSSRYSSSWVWPAAYCQQPKTLSFRNGHDPTMYKTINSAYNIADDVSSAAAADSRFANSSESASFSTGTASVDESRGGGGGSGDRAESSLETVIQGLRSERLFFQPGETSRSILEEANYKPQQVIININENKDDDDDDVVQNPIIKESVVLTMESRNPYVDFKKSMEEMVEANGLLLVDDDDDGNSSCSWDGLEELLCWYLRMNGRSNHGYIISAFVDLLVGNFANLSINNNNCNNNNNNNNMINHDNCGTTIITNYHPSPSSPLSFYTSSTSTSSKYSYDDSSSTPCCVSSLEAGEEIISTPQCFTLLESNEQ